MPQAEAQSHSWLARAVAWGLLWAVLGSLALYLLAPNPWPLQDARASRLRASLSVIDGGGPALLGYTPHTRQPYAIGSSDDQGIYVVVPVLSHWLGVSNPIEMLRWLWIAAWALTLLCSAAVAWLLFRSRWAALLTPPALLLCIVSFGFGDIYWVAAWVVVTFMPVLVLLARKRPDRQWIALVLIALIAGASSTIRSQAGVSVALAAAGVAAAVGADRRSLRAALVLVIALVYLLPNSVGMPLIREHRDHRIGVNLSHSEATSHPLWHSLYIGLGYTPNRYGIHYLDGYGAAAAHELDPAIPYLSPGYGSVLHKQIDALATHDPGFVAKTETEKAVVELSHAGRYLLLLALLLPLALTGSCSVRLRARELALFAPAVVIGLLPAIVAIPIRSYELGLLAPLGTLVLLAAAGTAARAESEWHASKTGTAGSGRGVRWALQWLSGAWPKRANRALLLTLAIILPAFVFARHLESEHEHWERERHTPIRVVLAGASRDARDARTALG